MLPLIATQSIPVSLFGAPSALPAASPVTATASSSALSYTGPAQSASASSAVSGLSQISSTGLSGVSSAQAIAPASASAPPAPFADLLTEAVGQVEQYESQAKSAVEGMMSGRGVDVHEAMMAADKAESGFELMLAVRNKALAAYQQVMGMQF